MNCICYTTKDIGKNKWEYYFLGVGKCLFGHPTGRKYARLPEVQYIEISDAYNFKCDKYQCSNRVNTDQFNIMSKKHLSQCRKGK